MNGLYDYLIAPFVDYPFMRRALIACFCVTISSGIAGIFLVMKRMSLVGDALGHGILPGIAVGFLCFGYSIWAMSIGGIIAGLIITLLATLTTLHTNLKEDASFTAFYLISLAAGVMIISKIGSQADLMHILFGSVLAIDRASLLFVFGTSTITLLVLSVIYRPLILYIIDPIYVRAIGWRGGLYYGFFLCVTVLNLVAGFQALGSLMAVGLLMLPPIIARLWANSMEGTVLITILVGILSSILGLLSSYHASLPTGPAIISCAGIMYCISLIFGKSGGILSKFIKIKHKTH